jgi:hypothetical protein
MLVCNFNKCSKIFKRWFLEQICCYQRNQFPNSNLTSTWNFLKHSYYASLCTCEKGGDNMDGFKYRGVIDIWHDMNNLEIWLPTWWNVRKF